MSIENGMRCPSCHQQMEAGNLPTGGGMHWHRKVAPAGGLAAEAVPGTHTWMRRAHLPAWRCRKCRYILFRYGEAIAPEQERMDLDPPSQEPEQEQEAPDPEPAP